MSEISKYPRKQQPTFPSVVRTNICPHCEIISRTPCLKVPENATSLFSGSKTVTLVTSLSVAFVERATRLRTVAEVEEAVGKNGGETMTR